jgi:hypothetical protein
LQALQQFAYNSADVAAARMCILQQPFLIAVLHQLLGMHGTSLPEKAVKWLHHLAQDSQQAAEQIAAQPGMLAGLARLLQPSSAPGLDLPLLTAGKHALLTIHHLVSYSTVCERAAAEPELLSSCVALLQAADRSEAAAVAVPLVLEVLLAFARSSAAGALQMVQQPAAIAALANVLSSQRAFVEPHGDKGAFAVQGLVLAVVDAVLNPEYAPITAQIVQHLQQQPQLMENMLLMATKKHPLGAATGKLFLGVALHNVQSILQLDPEAAKQIAALPAALTGLIKCLDNKDPTVRAKAEKVFIEVRKCMCQLVACSALSGLRWLCQHV